MSDYINHRDVSTAQELLDALDVLIGDADAMNPEAIHLRNRNGGEVRLTLREVTLADGSKSYTIHVGSTDADDFD